MANVIINDTHLTNIADAIREKTGTSDTYKPGEMATAIQAIPQEGGGGGGDLPAEAFKITGNCTYRFAFGGWDWFINLYGNKITTENISNANNMFDSCKCEIIPFEINLTSSSANLSYMFYSSYLKQLPVLKTVSKPSIPTSKYNFLDISSMFYNMAYLREIPEDYLTSIVPEGYWEAKETLKADGKSGAFTSCHSLRKIPNMLPYVNYGTYSFYNMYNQTFQSCYVLDEITNLPVEPVEYTSNCFSSSFLKCHRLKNITFATQEDGTPYTANWKSQTIDLSWLVGYGESGVSSASRGDITRYNSGITLDKEVKDDATYQALKDDPDWFTCEIRYSRYNHDSAVATINSLPDTSAYLAANGGTNTIKFHSAAGELTDGGAIGTLTDAEIAVATAKGWTVSIS